ncbi:MAG: hypothetical protein A2V98_15475 [Planctomycetes bacterium RBG_16_64_12]|nr:MAG: hypothetical protein A2V98_15475 [Planctomycetes bacterium RBG_16_64_12]
MKVFFVVLEVVVKLLIGLVTGIGCGALVFGILLQRAGVLDFSGPGPPPVETFTGVGAGLLTTALTLLVLFVGPFSRRRWFVADDRTDDRPPRSV